MSIRGGALFLSSADALQLLDWLDRSVPVASILRAIERAADARRKGQSRLPLTLRQAKRHLGKPTKGAFSGRNAVKVRPARPLDPLVERIEHAAVDDRWSHKLAGLAADIGAITMGTPDAMARETAAHIRSFHLEIWQDLPEADRESCRVLARDDLGDLRNLLDEVALTAIVEENARDSVRTRYGWLSMATVWDLIESWTPEDP